MTAMHNCYFMFNKHKGNDAPQKSLLPCLQKTSIEISYIELTEIITHTNTLTSHFITDAEINYLSR